MLYQRPWCEQIYERQMKTISCHSNARAGRTNQIREPQTSPWRHCSIEAWLDLACSGDMDRIPLILSTEIIYRLILSLWSSAQNLFKVMFPRADWKHDKIRDIFQKTEILCIVRRHFRSPWFYSAEMDKTHLRRSCFCWKCFFAEVVFAQIGPLASAKQSLKWTRWNRCRSDVAFAQVDNRSSW